MLIGEGEPGRVRPCWPVRSKKHERVAYGVPVTTIVMGDKAGQVPLSKLADHIKKLPKVLRPNQITDVRQRLRALDAVRPTIPVPKGPMPTSPRQVKGARQAMRGTVRRRCWGRNPAPGLRSGRPWSTRDRRCGVEVDRSGGTSPACGRTGRAQRVAPRTRRGCPRQSTLSGSTRTQRRQPAAPRTTDSEAVAYQEGRARRDRTVLRQDPSSATKLQPSTTSRATRPNRSRTVGTRSDVAQAVGPPRPGGGRWRAVLHRRVLERGQVTEQPPHSCRVQRGDRPRSADEQASRSGGCGMSRPSGEADRQCVTRARGSCLIAHPLKERLRPGRGLTGMHRERTPHGKLRRQFLADRSALLIAHPLQERQGRAGQDGPGCRAVGRGRRRDAAEQRLADSNAQCLRPQAEARRERTRTDRRAAACEDKPS